ncbi:hypothetical protein F4779DRAFT_590641 [Xylariaceae sp. FL0662B]|nr:hypothetical protein F4779DRAFT_590641 [Xylariaceae sp. FL0662B]
MFKAFEGYTSVIARLLQIFLSHVTIVPIQIIADISAEAYIAGARTFHQFRATVRVGFMAYFKFYSCITPVALYIAHRFLQQAIRTVFLNFALLLFYTYGNALIKNRRLAALRANWRKRLGDSSVGNRGEGTSTKSNNTTEPNNTLKPGGSQKQGNTSGPGDSSQPDNVISDDTHPEG